MKLPIRRVCSTAIVALTIASCAEPAKIAAPSPQPPTPNTPQNAARLFEWALVNRSVGQLETLLSEDFAWVTAGTDTSGNPARVIRTRSETLAAFQCMFEGVPGRFEPAQVALAFDRNLLSSPDPRPEYVDSLFKTIRTSMDLKILDPSANRTFEITGYLLFYLCRGDTAAIPAELKGRGFGPDRDRWWITRLEDETIASEGVPRYGTDPSTKLTFWSVLEFYLRRLFS